MCMTSGTLKSRKYSVAMRTGPGTGIESDTILMTPDLTCGVVFLLEMRRGRLSGYWVFQVVGAQADILQDCHVVFHSFTSDHDLR